MAQSAAAFLDEAPSAAAFLDAPDPKPSAAEFLDATEVGPQGDDAGVQGPSGEVGKPPLSDKQKGAFLHEMIGGSFLDQNPESLVGLDVAGVARAGIDAQAASSIAPGKISLQPLIDAVKIHPSTIQRVDPSYPQTPNSQEDQPVITFPTPTGDGVAAGIVRGAANVASSLTTPVNIGLAATMGGAPAALQRAAAVAFAAQMGSHVPESIQGIRDAKTPGETAQKSTEALAELILTGLAAKHGFGRPGEGGLPKGTVRPPSLSADQADALSNRIYTSAEMEKLRPEETPLSKDAQPITPETLDGLHLAREKLEQRLRQSPEDQRAPLQSSIDDIDAQLLEADKGAVQESAARVRGRDQSTPPAGEAEPAASTEVPSENGGTSDLFKQAKEESPSEQDGPSKEIRDHIEKTLTPDPEGTVTIRGKTYDAQEVEHAKSDLLEDTEADIVSAEDKRDKVGIDDIKSDIEDAEHEAKLARDDLAEVNQKLSAKDISEEDLGRLRDLREAHNEQIAEHETEVRKLRAKLAVKQKRFDAHQAEMDAHGKRYDELKAADVADKTPEPTENDWTEATNLPSAPMKRGPGAEGGFIKVPRIPIPDRKMSQLDQATTNRSAKLQRSTDDARRVQKEIAKTIPKEDRQGGVSLWIEADGDMAKLQAWEAGAKGEAFKKAAKAAQSLTPEELALAKKVRDTFKILESRGGKYDVLKSHRENYVPHVWDVEKSKPALTGGGRLQNNFKFAKARTFENFAEGDAAGFKPKTLAIGKLLPAYLHEMNKVIADRQFVEDLSQRAAKDGRPLVVPRGRVSEIEPDAGGKAYLASPRAMKGLKDAAGKDVDTTDYKTLENQPALHEWRWEGKDENGNPIFMKDDLAVHPEAAKRINSMLGKSPIREWYNEPGEGLSQIPKAILRGLDTAQSVMKREMFSLLAPFHMVQEGTHAVGHVVNPFFNIPKVDLRDAAQADAARHGLMLLPDKTNSQMFLEGVGGKGGFVSQIGRKFGGKAGQTVSDVIDGYQDYLFHQYIPGLKFKTYEAIRGRNMARYADELKKGEVTEEDVKLLSAEQSNAAYGHLNYALLDRSPLMQHVMQLGLLAPDFLEARSRFVGQAAKGLIGSKTGREQLKAIAVLAAVQAGVSYAMSKLMGDEWDPKHPFEVSHNGRTYMMRSVPEDLHRMLFQGPDQRREFVSGRINPVLQKGIQLETGLNYRGEKVGALDTMEELLANYIPITARSLPGIRQLTETSRKSPISPLEQLAGSLGLKISRHSPVSKTYQAASEWMEKQGIPKDKGSYPVSKYQQLRYALEDGDLEKAGDELKKLKAGTTPDRLAAGFRQSVTHPFTQSTAMDAKFRDSLSKSDRLVYDLALRKREQILSRFNLIRGK